MAFAKTNELYHDTYIVTLIRCHQDSHIFHGAMIYAFPIQPLSLA